MTVDITQEEMNILNLNGLSADDVKNNVEYQRALGFDDNAIREQFSSTIDQLRPLTKQSATDIAKIQNWQNKGPITPYEAAKRSSATFDGTYSNIDNTANLNLTAEQREKRAKFLEEQDQKITEWKNKQAEQKEKEHQEFLNKMYTPEKLERNKRVNEGTASFADRFSAYMDRGIIESERKNYTGKEDTIKNPYSRLIGTDNSSAEDKAKPIDFTESLVENGIMNGSMLPFVGGLLKGADDKKQRQIQDRIIKGEPIRQDELDFLNYRLDKQQEEKVRGYSLGGNISKGLLPSIFRFGSEMAVGGWVLKSLNLLPELATGANLGQKVTHGLSEMGKIGLANTALPTGWNETFEAYQGRRLNDELQFTDKGEWIFKESDEKPAISFMKSLMQTYIMFASEASGQLLKIPVQGATAATSKYIVSPISKYVLSNKKLADFIKNTGIEFSKRYEKLNNIPIKGKNVDWLKDKVRFDGFLEELGEEVVEDVLSLTAGIDNEERSLENYAKAIFKSPDEWAILAGAIALQGETLSVASHIIGSHLESNGASDEQIIETLNNLSENDKESAVAKLIQSGVLNLSDAKTIENLPTVKEQEAKSNIKSNYLEQFKNAGVDEVEANASAEIFTESLANLAKQTGISIEDVVKTANLEVENLTPEEAKEKYKSDMKTTLQGRVEKNVNNQLETNTQFQEVSQAGANEQEVEEAKKEWAEKGTESKYFKNWFGDSQVVDEDGNPLIVYHGTPNAGFEEFEINYPMFAPGNFKGAYFVDNISEAKDYGNNIMPVYVKIENPLIGNPYEEYAKAKGIDFNKNRFTIKKAEVENWIEEMGFDGIIKPKGTQYNLEGMEIIAFYPEQIKSVNNQGTFDSNNTNIYFQIGNENIYDNFVNKHKEQNLIDKMPEYWNGKTVEEAKKYLGFKNGKVELKTPIEKIKLYETHLIHLIEENNSYRKKYLNRVLETVKKPNLIIKNGVYNNYIKLFIDNNDKIKPHLQIVKVKNDGSFYVTTMKPSKSQVKKLILEGQVIYDLSSMSNTKSIDNNIIPQFQSNLNPNIKNSKVQFQEDGKQNFDVTVDTIDDVLAKNNLFYEKLEQGKEYKVVTTRVGGKLNVQELTFDRIDDKASDYTLVFKDKNGNEIKVTDNQYIYEKTTPIEQSVEAYRNALDEYESKLEENNTDKGIENSRGFTYETEFDGGLKNVIVLTKNKSDVSTLPHELAHVYLKVLNTLAKDNVKAREILLTVNKWLKADGTGYTIAQHEKFANNFVAYVRTGKAPTYNLKRVFEHFRRWLGDLFNSIETSDDIEISDEAREVFDMLLGGLSINNQKQQAQDLLSKAKNYAKLKMNSEPEKLAKKIKQNQLTDYQKRYRDTAYDIVFYALSHHPEGKNYVKTIEDLRMKLGDGKGKSLQRQRERIELLLAEADDVFSANDGFLPEWGEFFSDTGVSYDNQKLGADSELALDALDVIVNKRYLEDLENHQELSEDDVTTWNYEFDYIIQEYKNKKQDKSVVLSAFYDWIDGIHPYIQEDFVNKWELQTNEIDRYDALDKWQQAKEDLKIEAQKLKGRGDYSWQFAEYSRAIFKRLDFMTETDKAKIFNKLKGFNSFSEIVRNLDAVMDFAATIYGMSERRYLSAAIDKEVKRTIHEWQNGIKKTKYTYPANKLFERLRQINKMTIEDAEYLQKQINQGKAVEYVDDEINDKDYYAEIEKMFVQYKANGSVYNSAEFLQELLNRIQDAKFTAKLARDEMDYERRMNGIRLVEECAKAVSPHKNKISKFEKMFANFMNLNNALEMMFNKNIKDKFSLDYLYAIKDGKVGADRDVVLKKLKEIYKLEGKFADERLNKILIDLTKKEFKIKQRYSPDKMEGSIRVTHTDKESGNTYTDRTYNYDSYYSWEEEEIELSTMEVIYYYIQSKNATSYRMLTDMGDETTPPKGQFDKFEFDELINQLTPQEKLMGDILQVAAEKYYPELNAYHIKKYQTELGKVSNYFPRKSQNQEVKMLDLFNDFTNVKTNESFQKQRTAGAGVRIAPANALEVLFTHIEKANTIITMGEQLDLMNRVFKDSDLKNKIEATWGIDITKDFMQLVTSNLFSGQVNMISTAESYWANVMNNIVKSQIFLKPQIGLKQVMSFMNYGVGDEYVSWNEWAKKFAKQTVSPKEWKSNIEYMLNIPYLKDRFSRGGSTDALKRQLETTFFAKMNLLDNKLSANVRYGDISAIILGGKPYIDVLKDKGYSEEEAIKIFIEKTVNDQQSSIPSTLSNMQRNAAKNPFTKMFFAYQNTPWQYFRTASMSIVRATQNVADKKQAIKIASIYLFLFPMLFNMASSLSLVSAAQGDTDDLKHDLWKSIIGGVTFVPIAGMFVNAIMAGFLGDKANTDNWFGSSAKKMNKYARKINKGELTVSDIFDAVNLVGEFQTGLPLETATTQATGVADIAKGNVAKGLLKVGGYTEYKAKKITGEK